MFLFNFITLHCMIVDWRVVKSFFVSFGNTIPVYYLSYLAFVALSRVYRYHLIWRADMFFSPSVCCLPCISPILIACGVYSNGFVSETVHMFFCDVLQIKVHGINVKIEKANLGSNNNVDSIDIHRHKFFNNQTTKNIFCYFHDLFRIK